MTSDRFSGRERRKEALRLAHFGWRSRLSVWRRMMVRVRFRVVMTGANIVTTARRCSTLMIMVVMHLRASHTHVRLSGWCSHRGRIWDTRCTWSPWPTWSTRSSRPSHVVTMLRLLNSLAIVDLSHSPHSATPQSWVLIAVPPTVHCSLNQPSLASQAGIQLGQSPTDSVAFCLIVEAVALVLILVATCARIDAIFCLEFLREFFYIDRFDITSDGIFHLDTVPGVLERYPLDTVLVLPYNKWSRGGNRARGSIRIDICSPWCSGVHVRGTYWRTLRSCLRRAQARWRALQRRLCYSRLRAPHTRGVWMGRLVWNLLALLMRDQ